MENTLFALAGVAQLVGASSHKQKVMYGFDWFLIRVHLPRLRVGSLVWACAIQGRGVIVVPAHRRGNQSMFLSHTYVSLTPSLYKSNEKKNVLGWGFKKRKRKYTVLVEYYFIKLLLCLHIRTTMCVLHHNLKMYIT